jgi:hypothetical protein
VLVVGVLVPDIGTLVLTFVPAPSWIDPLWIRLAMLAGALIVPALIGIAALFVTTPDDRPHDPRGIAVTILRGYPFAFVLALLMAVLLVVATVRKLRSLAKRWEDAHVPVMVKPGRYDDVLALLQRTLLDADLRLMPRPAGIFISGPPRLLNLVAGRALGELVPDELILLASPGLEVLVYPSDLTISGKKDLLARARAAIASKLVHAPAYLTTTAEAQKFEDALEQIQPADIERTPDVVVQHVRSLDGRLAHLAVPFDEWETLYRMRLQLERDGLVAEVEGHLPEDFVVPGRGALEPTVQRGRSRLDLAIAVGGASLMLLDLIAVLSGRFRSHRKR